MDQYIDYSAQAGFHEVNEDFGQGNFHHNTDYDQHNASSSVSQRTESGYFNNTRMPHSINCDIKPRLTKEQHDILEAHFQKQHKPNTNTKKQVAENLGVSLDKVNVSVLSSHGRGVVAKTLR